MKKSGVDRRVVFEKGGFGGCSPGTKTGTRIRSHVPRNENGNKTALMSTSAKKGKKEVT